MVAVAALAQVDELKAQANGAFKERQFKSADELYTNALELLERKCAGIGCCILGSFLFFGIELDCGRN